ncbi:MAG: hypothetical protein MRY74_00975 [Neomegalonema sp.]|nr:hypothetical protein [Neomegalonema sp.]
MASSDEPSDSVRVGPVRSAGGTAGRRREVNFARILRVVLPLSAVALVVAIFLVGDRKNSGQFALSIDPATLVGGTRVENPRLTGVTEEGSIYSFQAAVARLDSVVPDKVGLEGVRGTVDMPNGRSVRMIAAEGVLTQSTKTFRLGGGVRLATSDGYQVHMRSIVADGATRVATTDKRVIGYGPAGRICSLTMKLTEGDGGVARFEGDVVVILTALPGQKKKAAAKEKTAAKPVEVSDEGEKALAARRAAGLKLDPDEKMTVCQRTVWALDETARK